MADINVTEQIIDINVTEEVIVIEAPSGGYPLPASISSVFGRTGAIIATIGDYNTSLVTENTNLYFTNARARSAISLTTTGTSGAATYNNTTGVFNIPQYQGGVTSFNTRTGAISLTSADVSGALTYVPYNSSNPSGYITGITSGNVTTALGYTPVTNARTLTINGTTFDLTADRSWTITGGVSSVFGRTGAVVAVSGDYTTTQVTEGTNLYYTDVRARASLSFASGSGAYNSTTGVITIPTNNNQITNGAGYITSSALSTYVPYTGATTNLNLGTNNLSSNNAFLGFSSIAASGTQLVLTIASAPTYIVTGSGGQTIKLPDATTLPNGANYVFNNNQSSGAILVNNNSNTLIVSIPSGGYCTLELTDNSIAAGSWDRHFEAPSNVNWSTNTLDYAGSITSATWNGNAVAVNRGGTGQSTYTDGQLLIGNSTGNTLTKANLSAGTGISITNGGGSISIASSITQYTDALARASISETVTGLDYNSTTGVLSTTTGYAIPTTASQTNWDTAYTNRITSLTTTGSSGAATLTSNTLNIPNYTLAGLGGISLTSLSATTPLNYNNTTGVFTITQASASANGFLASGDFTTFNNKQGAITLTTTGTSGAATLVGNTLNIPQYSGGGGGGMAIGGAITSATEGSILFVGSGGVLAQNNSNFNWDNTNGRLQITNFKTTNSQVKIGSLEIQSYSLNNSWFSDNMYYSGSNFVYRSTGKAVLFYFLNGEGQFRSYASGAAGSNAPNAGYGVKLKFNELGNFGVGLNINESDNVFDGSFLRVFSTGNVTINQATTDSGFRLDVNGTARVQGATTIAGDTSISGVLRATITTNRQTASYTLVLADRGKLVEMNVATANNLTIPLNSSVAFPIGTQIDLSQYGAGQTTVVATGGVTIRSTNSWVKLNAQYAAATLIKIGTDEWYLFGNLNA